MTIEQTIEIPANRRLVVDVPSEVPAGLVILSFTPVETIAPAMSEKTDESSPPVLKKERVFGCAKGQFRMADDFDAPLEDFKDYM